MQPSLSVPNLDTDSAAVAHGAQAGGHNSEREGGEGRETTVHARGRGEGGEGSKRRGRVRMG
eukprot:1604291-Prymnesium_polylepis.1